MDRFTRPFRRMGNFSCERGKSLDTTFMLCSCNWHVVAISSTSKPCQPHSKESVSMGGSLDKWITFRFYRVVRDRRSRTSFEDALSQISNIRRPSARERQLTVDYHARAEVIARERGAIVGEMTRIQRTNTNGR